MQPATAIKLVPLPTWATFFAAIAYPSRAPATYREIQEVFQKGEPQGLLDAVAAVCDLGTDAAREELVELAPRLWTPERHQLGAADLALRLWIESLTSEETATALRKVRVVAEARVTRRTMHMFRSPEPAVNFDMERVRLKLAHLVGPRLAAAGYEGETEVHASGAANQVVQFTIARGSRVRERRLIEKNKRHLRRQTEEEDDTIKLTAGRTIKVVATRSLARVYQEAIGEALTGKPSFFSEPLMYDLRKLLDGTARLDGHGIADLVRVSLVELEVDKGESRFAIRSPDGEAEVRLLAPYLETAQVRNATLKLQFGGRQRREVKAKLGSPNSMALSNSTYEPTVDRLLESAGLLISAMHSRPVRSLWEATGCALTFAEGYDTYRDRWRGLVEQKVYREVPQKLIPSPAMPAAGRHLSVNRSEDNPIGVSSDEGLASMELTPTHLLAYELDAHALASLMAKALGTRGEVRETPDWPGVFDLGERPLKVTSRRFFLVSKELSRDQYLALSSRLSLNGRLATTVVICPQGQVFEPLRACSFELAFPWPEPNALFPEVVRRLALEHEVDAVHRVSPAVRLVVDFNAQAVWFDTVPIEGITGHSLDLLFLLAKRASAGENTALSEEVVADKINATDSGRVRQLLGPIEKKVAASFAALGKPAPDGFRSLFKAAKGYRFSGTAAAF